MKLTRNIRTTLLLAPLAALHAEGVQSANFGSSVTCSITNADDKPWVVFEGKAGAGHGKHVVFVSGDDEYHSEEGLPMLAKIFATHHGFKCTVLFAINKTTGVIDPSTKDNIPGLEALDHADLMVILTRFRDLPDDQMKHIVDYVESGHPVIGLRTATHAFQIAKGKTYAKYGNTYTGADYDGGFGRQVLGEKWINHHGNHGKQSARAVIAPGMEQHPILRGIISGEIWGPCDVYGVRLPLPGDSKPLLLGQVLEGMKPEDKPVVGKQNDPMMPVAWIKTYTGAQDKSGRVFTTTMGGAMAGSSDLLNEAMRRLIVNAAYWAVGLEDQIPAKSNVEIVGATGFKKGIRSQDVKD